MRPFIYTAIVSSLTLWTAHGIVQTGHDMNTRALAAQGESK